MRVGLALTGHWLALDAVVRLARLAEAHGFEVLFVDGDTADVPARERAPLYEAGALQGAVLAATTHLRVAAIRLPGFMPVVLQARALATLQTASGGRAIAFFGVGAGRSVSAIGLREYSAAERISLLDESLHVLRSLWNGAPLVHESRFIQLSGARSAPSEPPPKLVVAAARSEALKVVARHADVWDANVPPLAEYLEPARARLARPLETWIWVFARPGDEAPDAARAYRRHCPWFAWVPREKLQDALLCGEPRAWPERVREIAGQLRVDLVVLDLIGLDEDAAEAAIQAFPPAQGLQMS